MIQALATLPRLREWLGKAVEKHRCRLGSALDEMLRGMHIIKYTTSICLSECVQNNYNYLSFLVLNEDSDAVQSPYTVLQALMWHCWSIDSQQQVSILTIRTHIHVGNFNV